MLARENMRSVYSEEHQQEQGVLLENMRKDIDVVFDSIDYDELYKDEDLRSKSEMMANRVGIRKTMAPELVSRFMEMVTKSTSGFASSQATFDLLLRHSCDPFAGRMAVVRLVGFSSEADASTMKQVEGYLFEKLGRLSAVEGEFLAGPAFDFEISGRNPQSIDRIVKNTQEAAEDATVGLADNDDAAKFRAAVAAEVMYVTEYLEGLRPAA